VPASYGSPELILLAAIVTLLFAAPWIPQLRPTPSKAYLHPTPVPARAR
jgi:hypothetical protein